MSNIEHKPLLEQDQSKDVPKSKEKSCNSKSFVCLYCKHICICGNKKPTLSKSEENLGGNTCRSYECLKNQYATCKLRKTNEEKAKSLDK